MLIVCVASDVDQTLPLDCDDVKSTEPPEQNEVEPLTVTTGAAGAALTVTEIGDEVTEQPFPSEYVTE